ncbi:MAG: hypothetical protein ACK4HW_12440 [Roseinatronobacter sp.]
MRRTITQTLRLTLPLGAVALMSMIFLASRSVDPNRAVALSDLDLEEFTREPRIGGARFAGVGETGTALNITAASLRSGTDPRTRAPLDLILDAPRGKVAFAGGGTADFQAAHGRIDQAGDEVVLTGAVALETSAGYRVTLDALHSDLGANLITGTGPVQAVGPAGKITAQAVTLRAGTGQGGGYVLAFTGDVRLLYVPDGQGAEP